MKSISALLFSVAAGAAVIAPSQNQASKHALFKRQQLDGQLGYLTAAAPTLTELKPAKTINMPPKSGHPGAKRIKVYYGPFEMLGANVKKTKNPMSLDPNGNSWNNWVSGIPLDATYLYEYASLELENGKVATLADGIYNHHLAYVSTKKVVPQFMQCPGQPLKTTTTPATLMGATQEKDGAMFTTPDLKFKSGFYLSPNDKIVVTGEIVNYSNDTKKIYAVSDLEYVTGKPKGWMDVVIQIISVNQCEGGNLSLRPPVGQKIYSVKSQNMTILHDGYILNRQGHMHDGGTNIEFWVNDKLICDSKAIYGGQAGTRTGANGEVWETMSGVVECTEPIQVKKGDRIYLQSNYDLVKHPARTHAGEVGTDHGKEGGGHGNMMAEEMALISFSFATA